jgi:hypothetical protein
MQFGRVKRERSLPSLRVSQKSLHMILVCGAARLPSRSRSEGRENCM